MPCDTCLILCLQMHCFNCSFHMLAANYVLCSNSCIQSLVIFFAHTAARLINTGSRSHSAHTADLCHLCFLNSFLVSNRQKPQQFKSWTEVCCLYLDSIVKELQNDTDADQHERYKTITLLWSGFSAAKCSEHTTCDPAHPQKAKRTTWSFGNAERNSVR